MKYTHTTAPTQFVEANGIRFAYRRFGQDSGTPLVLMPHFRAGMDHWDPAVTDGLAASRPVVLFDNAGVAGSGAETPETIESMADHAADFLKLALRHPEIVRQLVLVGTGPRGGEATNDPKVGELGASTDPSTGETGLEAFLYLFFRPSETSQVAGKAFWARRHMRKDDVDPPSSPQTMKAQRAAINAWREVRGERYSELKNIEQPTLVVNGNHDIMVPTINAYVLSQEIRRAQLILYPDSGHASLFQYPELFVAHCRMFLDDPPLLA